MICWDVDLLKKLETPYLSVFIECFAHIEIL